MSDAQKAKISAATNGLKRSEETRRRMSEAALRKYAEGRVPRPEGVLNSFFGKKHSEETKQKIGNANRKSK